MGKETELKNIVLDINALKLKKKNMAKKIENATAYIQEIDSHKKSIFEFWKYSNKDEISSLPEGEEEEVNIEKKTKNESDYKEDVELLDMAGNEFDLEKVRKGQLSPVCFGSALTNFGIEPFLKHFLEMTTSPLPRSTGEKMIDPFSEDFSAFVFKIQANMNKAHRDRMAFFRICSGKFTKGMEVYHYQGKRKIKLNQSKQLMADERQEVEEAYAGDIIGVFDPGIFSIGDTITTGKEKFAFEGIPTFAPEHFSLIRNKDTMKRKQFVKGVEQIAQEGAIQIFTELGGGMEEIIVGVVGVLQFEVLTYRLKNEYNVDIVSTPLPYQYIRWIKNDQVDFKKLNLSSDTKKVQDLKGQYLLLFSNEWGVRWATDKNPDLVLAEFSQN